MPAIIKAPTILFLTVGLLACSPENQTQTADETRSLPSILTLDDLGVPNNFDQRLDYSSFSIGYNYSRKHADWVGAALLPELVELSSKRNDAFFEEVQIPDQYRAKLADYVGSGYDRGHLAPNATHDQTRQSMTDTFTLANMSPQLPAFNRGDWAQLEQYIRDCVANYPNGSPVFSFTGPYYGNLIDEIGESKIPVPEGYYKVIYVLANESMSAMAFKAPQKSFDFNSLANYMVTVDTIEQLTQLDFATNLPKAIEVTAEQEITAVCPIPENSQPYSCTEKQYCSQMKTCEEAKYYLNTCGLSGLDRDKDGTPCEAICK